MKHTMFEFGETEQANALFDRNPKFYAAFEGLMTLSNKVFGRASTAKNRPEDVCFSQAHTCRNDYLETLFLAVNGYGVGASKILRGLYERAVTLAYIDKHPEKAERFGRFAAIQEYRALESALKVVTDKEFDEAFRSTMTVAQIRASYEKVKPEFPGRAIAWDGSLISMVTDVGDPFDKYYLGSYTIPNFHVHATLASGLSDEPLEVREKQNIQEADFALRNATVLLLLVIRQQNKMFNLNRFYSGGVPTCQYTWT